MNRIIALLKSSMLRWWLMITAILSVSSTCPCCGKPACPVGFGAGAFIAGIFVLIGRAGMMIRDSFRDLVRKKSLD